MKKTSPHLIMTEGTAIAICHLFDSFCHQLAAKSTSPKTRKRRDLYVYYSVYALCSFYIGIHRIAINLLQTRTSDLRRFVHIRGLMGGIKLSVFPISKFVG